MSCIKCSVLLFVFLLAIIQPGLSFSQSGEVSSSSQPPAKREPLAFKKDNDGNLPSLGYIGGLTLFLGLGAVVVVVLIKKRLLVAGQLPASPGEKIVIVDRKALHGGHHIYLFDIEGRTVVSIIGPQQSSMSLLDSLPRETDV